MDARSTGLLCLASVVMVGCASQVPHARIVAAAGGVAGPIPAAGTEVQPNPSAGGLPTVVESGQPSAQAIGAAAVPSESTSLPVTGPASTGPRQSVPPSSTKSTAATKSDTGAKASSSAGGDTSPIAIGNVGTYSGVFGAEDDVATGVQLWAKYTNGTGGLYGHPLTVTVGDDAGDAARHASLVQQQVEQNKVVALVGNADAVTLTQNTVDYLAGKGVAAISGDDGSGFYATAPGLFGQGPTGSTVFAAGVGAAAQQAKAAGLSKVGIIACQEAQTCTDFANAFKALATRFGLDPVYQASASVTQVDFTGECLNARSSGAQVLLVVMDNASTGRIASNCARQNYKPHYATSGVAVVNSQASDANLDGTYINEDVFPWFVSDSPARQAFAAALAQYLPGQKATAGLAAGWVAGVLFGRSLRGVSGPITAAKVTSGLRSIRGDTLGGLTAPLSFGTGSNNQQPACWFNIRIQNKAFAVAPGPQPACA